MHRIIILLAVVLCLGGCTLNAYQNKRIADSSAPAETKAAYEIKNDRGAHQKTLGILALSGGGSRAAYWSASAMLALEEVFWDEGLNILDEIDAISSVSGGSLPAAYYAVSYSPDISSHPSMSKRTWDKETVLELMGRNYKRRWFGNWFWPVNIFKYWFTSYDRSDIMAQTLADNLYDIKGGVGDLKFKHINPERPNLVLNATNGTKGKFSDVFTFTNDDFNEINSDINEYEISNAVMATAAFPAAFNFMTLRDFNTLSDQETRYIHVFDGGNSDNLGLKSAQKIIAANAENYERIFVILIDAFTRSKGINNTISDARKGFDYAIDSNFLDSVDSLLATNREKMIEVFKKALDQYHDKNFIFYHMEFNDISKASLNEELHQIKTDFAIKPEEKKAIESAIDLLIVKENDCIAKIRNLIVEKNPEPSELNCKWTTQ